MGTSVFPTLSTIPGRSIEFSRDAIWDGTDVVTSASGKDTAISYWSSPRWQWELKFNYLRTGVRYSLTRAELETLTGFFNARQGQYDSFLFTADDDNSVTDQPLGTGTGAQTAFQLLRSYGGFTEPVYAPNVITNVKVNNVVVSPLNYTVSTWGSSVPGVVTFTSAPGTGLAVTSSFTYYWPCRFLDRRMSFKRFLSQLYEANSVKFLSLK